MGSDKWSYKSPNMVVALLIALLIPSHEPPSSIVYPQNHGLILQAPTCTLIQGLYQSDIGTGLEEGVWGLHSRACMWALM